MASLWKSQHLFGKKNVIKHVTHNRLRHVGILDQLLLFISQVDVDDTYKLSLTVSFLPSAKMDFPKKKRTK